MRSLGSSGPALRFTHHMSPQPWLPASWTLLSLTGPSPPGKPPMDCRHLPEARKETLSPEPESPPPPAASSSPCLPPAVGQRAGTGPGRPAAANAARERSRVQTLRHAFLELQKTLPSVPPDTKLSKLDTLRLASSYIAHLRQLLQEDRYENGYVHPVNLVRDAGGGARESAALGSSRCPGIAGGAAPGAGSGRVLQVRAVGGTPERSIPRV